MTRTLKDLATARADDIAFERYGTDLAGVTSEHERDKIMEQAYQETVDDHLGY